ncbi:MAG: cysteine desulfurase [Xanthobacteraceae bacterium]|nr:cysteine desulfurase [Xanthobacteraceae bacterium]
MAIYLDHNATTPVAPEVLDAMLPFLREEFGNPSSNSPLGHRAKDAIEAARHEVAVLIGAQPDGIVFTSGGTEASNMAIRGTVEGQSTAAIVTSTIEHPATEEPCRWLARQGHAVHRIPARDDGRIDLDAARHAIGAATGLVTLIHAQNETGVLQPVFEVAAMTRRHGIPLHIDAAQSAGKIPIDVAALGIDLLSLAGHKLYAPKGIGALYVRSGTRLAPMLRGAGQEGGRRPGTENVAFIVGLGAACRLAAGRLAGGASETAARLAAALFARLRQAIPGIVLVGHPTERLPNTLNVLFPETTGRAVLENCPEVIASTGSACHADREEASHALRALGIPEHAALGAVRLSLGFATTAQDVEAAADALITAWRQCRAPHRARA